MSEKPKRRWYQFSLKTMLVLMGIGCVIFGIIAYRMEKVRRREEAIEAIMFSFGGGVGYANNDSKSGEVTIVTIWVDKDKFTDDAMRYLKEFPKLERLNLMGCKNVTDTGLAHIAGLNRLKRLDVRGTQVSRQAVQRLTADIPGLSTVQGEEPAAATIDFPVNP